METYQLEKSLWDDNDFADMRWHDATVWSMCANSSEYEFLFDLDYLFKWVHPFEGETYFKFWVAPVTMVFENAHSIKINIDSSQGAIEVADLHRGTPEPTPNGKLTQYSYRFECQEGEIALRSTGFNMYVRRTPELLKVQGFGLQERGGVSFERAPGAT